MPKQKQLLNTNKKKNSRSTPAPQTADEFLAAGVDFEEAGEKWRAGDAAKSSRFFVRAIETYEKGLERFPQSFDLAYNKARIQYDITQQPKLLLELPTSSSELMQLALQSHRYALNLRPDNADIIFNTGQVLTSIAETLSEGVTRQNDKQGALRLLYEALKLFQQCLDLQESQFAHGEDQKQADIESSMSVQGELSHSSPSSPTSGASSQEQWVSIVEPITRNTLLDTTIAQIETLTEACSLLSSQGHDGGLPWTEEFSQNILNKKLELYVESSERAIEIALVKANFTCAYADASFRTGRIDLPTYEREVDNAFDSALDLSDSPRGLCDRADALLAFTSSIRAAASVANLPEEDSARLNQIQWKRLSSALVDLKAASMLSDGQILCKIHMRRGDCELLRFRLGLIPSLYLPALENAAMLLKNSGVYYRGAASAAAAEKSPKEELEAFAKEAVVAMLAGDVGKASVLSKKQGTEDILEDMLEEGLIDDQIMQRLRERDDTSK